MEPAWVWGGGFWFHYQLIKLQQPSVAPFPLEPGEVNPPGSIWAKSVTTLDRSHLHLNVTVLPVHSMELGEDAAPTCPVARASDLNDVQRALTGAGGQTASTKRQEIQTDLTNTADYYLLHVPVHVMQSRMIRLL